MGDLRPGFFARHGVGASIIMIAPTSSPVHSTRGARFSSPLGSGPSVDGNCSGTRASLPDPRRLASSAIFPANTSVSRSPVLQVQTIEMVDRAGSIRLRMGVAADGTPSVRLYDYARTRCLDLAVRPDRPAVTVFDGQGVERRMFEASPGLEEALLLVPPALPLLLGSPPLPTVTGDPPDGVLSRSAAGSLPPPVFGPPLTAAPLVEPLAGPADASNSAA